MSYIFIILISINKREETQLLGKVLIFTYSGNYMNVCKERNNALLFPSFPLQLKQELSSSPFMKDYQEELSSTNWSSPL